MENEFIPYKQALILKELGFDEPCFKGYTEEYKTLISFANTHTNTSVKNTLPTKPFTAPLYQQAFRWFREKYNLFHNIWNYTHGEPTDLIPNGFTFSIDEDWVTIIGKKEDGYFEKYYNTYEEAELECLIKLIEIVKKK
jgi:hypothetical protein